MSILPSPYLDYRTFAQINIELTGMDTPNEFDVKDASENEYEARRKERIRRNEALLEELGLSYGIPSTRQQQQSKRPGEKAKAKAKAMAADLQSIRSSARLTEKRRAAEQAERAAEEAERAVKEAERVAKEARQAAREERRAAREIEESKLAKWFTEWMTTTCIDCGEQFQYWAKDSTPLRCLECHKEYRKKEKEEARNAPQ